MSDGKYEWKLGLISTRRGTGPRRDVDGQLYGPVGLHEEGHRWRLTDLDSGMCIKSFPFDGMVESCKQEEVAMRCAEYIAANVLAMVGAKKALGAKVGEFVAVEENRNG